jgi:predicted Zn-dependent protease
MIPQDLVERAIELSTVDGCVVLVEESDGANVRWANNTLTTNGSTHGQRVTVISTVGSSGGTAVGVLTRTGVDGAGIADLVGASEAAARAAGPAVDAQPLVAGGADAGWSASPERTSIEVFTEFAPSLGEAFEAARAAGHRLFGYAEHTMTTTYLGTSAGLRRRHAQPTGSVALTGKSDDLARSAYLGLATDDFVGIDVPALGAELDTRLDWAKRGVELPAGRYETLIPPNSVADLYALTHYFAGAARDAVDGRSVYSKAGGGTRIGDQLCGDQIRVTVASDPAAPGLRCAPFVMAHANNEHESVFDDGLALTATDWIRDGVLTTLTTTRYTAAAAGLPVAPFIDNLRMEASTGGSGRSLAEMVAATERGLLLTSLWYLGLVDPQTMLLTGLTRDGVYLVEGGEVTGAVNNFRFNDSPVELLHRLAEVGRTERCYGREFGEYFNRSAMPPLRVGDFNMSSVSQAA